MSGEALLKYKLLDASEWDRLKEIVELEFIPSPQAAAAAIAEDDSGNLTGVLFLQIVMHLEPLVLKSPQVNFERLHDLLHNAVQQHKGLHIYAFSDKDVVDRMAKHVGMKELPYKVFEEVL